MLLPARVTRPDPLEIDHSAGLRGGLQKVERGLDDRALILDVAELAGGVTQPVIDERGAWWGDSERDVARRRERRGWNAFGFEAARDQTDRLVADRSHRHEQRRVGALVRDRSSDRGRELVAHPA